jgi:MFS transporter, FHS family, L-fucose permease
MINTSSPGEGSLNHSGKAQSYRGPFAIMTTLFFIWGFMTVWNDILIPQFKEAFTLNYFQAMLVQFAFFGAYFIGSVLYFTISATKGDPIAKIGYKNAIVMSLLICAFGSLLFWPAAGMLSYPLFLIALFVVGIGFAVLQIAANPYVTILGPEETASSRLNLAQGFNSVGTTLGPLIGGYLIFEYFNKAGVNGAASVKVPYLAFSIVFLILAAIFYFVHLPHVGEGKIEPGAQALKYPHVVLGVIAIFMYVGGEVSIGSSIINFLGQKSIAGLTPIEASKFVSLFWFGMLIGRFMGATELSRMRRWVKQVLLAAIPIVLFIVPIVMLGWHVAVTYIPLLFVCWLLFQFGKSNDARTLTIFMGAIVVLLLTAIFVGGRVAMWCVVGVGLFTSIGWSNTFSLALDGTGIYKSQVSSLLVAAILGGAILPPAWGHLADVAGPQIAYIVPLIAYAYVGFYGLKGHRIGRNKPQAAA